MTKEWIHTFRQWTQRLRQRRTGRWWLIGGGAVLAVGAVAATTCWLIFGCGERGPGVQMPFAVCWTDRKLPPLARPRVMICKSQYLMTVFDGDRAVKSYRVAVGKMPGDKQREGDRRTPEGELTVCMKNPQSKYVLSLGLSYPDERDAERGLREGMITQAEHDAIVRASRQGVQPPWNTALGGEIMIHGCRKDRKHTLGCIAVEDDHIRELYPRLPVGTKVTVLP